MEHNIQISVDCADPHAQADWWAETLGWTVEPVDGSFLDQMLAAGHATEADVMEHKGARVWKAGAAVCRAGDLGQRDRMRLVFQPVPEPKTLKNRVHLDIHLTGEDKDRARDALVARGARFLYSASQGPLAWYTMADPEGNEFCVS
ncbi:VOC family protein [Arthrobacter sp. TMN-37]